MRIVFAVILSILLSGCATGWSPSEKEKLRAVSISPATAGSDSYRKPDATDSPGMGQSIPAATGGGLIPALVGSAIDATVTAKQQRKFEEKNLQYFEALQKSMSSPPTDAVTTALKGALTQHSFFGPRIVERSTTNLTTEILNFGLQKSPISKDDDILLRVRIVAKITIKLPDGTRFFEFNVKGVASTAKRAREILTNPDFIAVGISEAATDMAE